jgi:hypothetical protein
VLIGVTELEQAASRLREAGLKVDVTRVGEEWVRLFCWKPSNIPGNKRVKWALPIDADGAVDHLDAPWISAYQIHDQSGWWVYPHIFIGGFHPKPWDRHFGNLSEAVEAILGYYFGDPSWMQEGWDNPAEQRTTADRQSD